MPVNPRSVRLKGHLYQVSPAGCSAKGSQLPPPSARGTCWAGWSWLHLAGPCSSLPSPLQASLQTGWTYLSNLLSRDSVSPKLLPISVSPDMLGLLPGGPFSLAILYSCKQDQTFWELSAGLLGVRLPGPGSGHPSLQEQGWQSARGLGPTAGCPAAAAGRWLLPGRKATPQQRCLSRNLGLWGRSSHQALPQAWRVPPRRLQQPYRSALGAARGREGAGVTGPSPKTVPFLLQPPAPTWVESCLLPGATSWMLELEQLCVWRWCILTPQG